MEDFVVFVNPTTPGISYESTTWHGTRSDLKRLSHTKVIKRSVTKLVGGIFLSLTVTADVRKFVANDR